MDCFIMPKATASQKQAKRSFFRNSRLYSSLRVSEASVAIYNSKKNTQIATQVLRLTRNDDKDSPPLRVRASKLFPPPLQVGIMCSSPPAELPLSFPPPLRRGLGGGYFLA
ncbi:hypothetical protein [Helicobacter macacae]|uniref:hypothetical protein n=1 Tax=Helicobacter macacae TaxID=398626 RepID=UPI000551B3C6|nr:hypothetical protein [Helicobacter macacae]